jgi:hypothetical protein
MMVIMHEAATEAEVEHVSARVDEVGASAHLSLGDRVTVIGVIGDREEITELPLEAMPGVDRVVAILRPYKLVSREFQQRDTVIDVSAVPVIKLASHLPVVVDQSHSAGRLDLVLPLSLAGVAAGADGVLVETHPNPEHALCDGPQSLPTAVFGEYAERVLDLARWTGKTA